MTVQSKLASLLSQGLQAMTIPLTESQQSLLVTYIELLTQWNSIHNLTAIRDPEEMINRHILDSLTLLPFLTTGKNVCDVGTGAGLPGLILAVAKPELNFVLVDSSQKKINFVQQAILKLRLANAKALCTRVEQFHPASPFDWIVSRAFSSLSDFIQQTEALGGADSTWLAMKGKLLQEELAALPAGYTMEQMPSVFVPNLEAERHIVVVKKRGKQQ